MATRAIIDFDLDRYLRASKLDLSGLDWDEIRAASTTPTAT